MQAFIAAPLLHSSKKNIDYYNEIGQVCSQLGIKPFLPHIETEPFDKPASASLVFKQDITGLQQCNVVIADTTSPSHGVGSELMLAFVKKIPIICLHRIGPPPSRMVLGNPMVIKVIRYESRQDCLAQLRKSLELFLTDGNIL